MHRLKEAHEPSERHKWQQLPTIGHADRPKKLTLVPWHEENSYFHLSHTVPNPIHVTHIAPATYMCQTLPPDTCMCHTLPPADNCDQQSRVPGKINSTVGGRRGACWEERTVTAKKATQWAFRAESSLKAAVF